MPWRILLRKQFKTYYKLDIVCGNSFCTRQIKFRNTKYGKETETPVVLPKETNKNFNPHTSTFYLF